MFDMFSSLVYTMWLYPGDVMSLTTVLRFFSICVYWPSTHQL